VSGYIGQRPATMPIAYASGAMRPGRSTFRTVLLASDLSAVSKSAAEEAFALCAALGARLLVMNVIDSRSGFGRQRSPAARVARMDQLRVEREGKLRDLVREARSQGIDASFLVWIGEPGQSIVSAADAEGADLVVVGTRALDRAGRFLLGSVSDYVVNHSPCPVLIAR
jgi:nucleotide-binding universal stress UspA family protein